MNDQTTLSIPTSTTTLSLLKPPSPVGYWILDPGSTHGYNMMISLYAKPTDEQIANTERMFGWKWKDA